MHAHLSHRALPLEGVEHGRLLRFWAAASVALLLAALGILLLVGAAYLARTTIREALATR